jgi:hypothetical protein
MVQHIDNRFSEGLLIGFWSNSLARNTKAPNTHGLFRLGTATEPPLNLWQALMTSESECHWYWRLTKVFPQRFSSRVSNDESYGVVREAQREE